MAEREQLEQTIAALEAQRAMLGDLVVEAALSVLRARLEALGPVPERRPDEATVLSRPEQRKQVTVLFADLSGFTGLAETKDSEEVGDLLQALWGHLDPVIQAHEGFIDKHIGDAVMALWGAEAASEQDPERAIRAALEMQDSLATFCRERGLSLAMRIGLDTGTALLGTVGTRTEFTALGDVVNVASRLQNAAPPGGVLIAYDVYRHVRGLFDVLPQGPLIVKGRQEPVPAYLVRAARPRAFHPATRGVEGVETRTVGRCAELDILWGAFSAAMRGEGAHTVTVVGEAGIGKSRLLYEFEKGLGQQPERVLALRGRAVAELAHVPYHLIRDLFSRWMEIFENDDTATTLVKFEAGTQGYLEREQAHLIGHLVGFDFSSTAAVTNLVGSESYSRLARAYLLNYLRGLIAEGPTVVLLEDLHWADLPSLEIVTALLHQVPQARLLVVGLARPDLYERCPAWGSSEKAASHQVRLDLAPLAPEDSRILVGEILRKVNPLPNEFRELIVERAEGNPLCIEELVNMFLEEKVIVRGEERWWVQAARLQDIRVPPTLAGVLQARLDSLPAAMVELLQRAAVVGRRFWDSAVAALRTEGDRDLDVPAHLSAAQQHGLVFSQERSAFSGTTEYMFKHALFHEAVYETVLLKRRRVYHDRAAHWLEASGGERVEEYARLIAGHYERASQTTQAAIWLRRAGEAALQKDAYRDAIAAFERTLGLLAEGDRAGRAELSIELGNAYAALSDYPAAYRYLEDGLALAHAVNEQGLAARALAGLGRAAGRQGRAAQAHEHAAEALRLARQAGDLAAEKQALRVLGSAAFFLDDTAASQRYDEENLRLCRESGDLVGQASCLNNLGTLFSAQGDYGRAMGCLQESLSISREIGNRRGSGLCLNNLGIIAMRQGDYAQAQRCSEECLAIYREIGDRRGAAYSLNNLAMALLRQGDYASAVRYGGEGLALGREVGDRNAVATSLATLGHAVTLLDRDNAAWGYYHQALVEACAIDSPSHMLAALAGLADLFARAGDYAQAVRLLGSVLCRLAPTDTGSEVASAVLARLRAVLPAAELEAALEAGQALDLQQVVDGLLAQVSPNDGESS